MAFRFKLEQVDGTPADPPTLHTAVPNWQIGDTIPLGANRMLRVIEIRFEDDDPVLVVRTCLEVPHHGAGAVSCRSGLLRMEMGATVSAVPTSIFHS